MAEGLTYTLAEQKREPRNRLIQLISDKGEKGIQGRTVAFSKNGTGTSRHP